jgi:hypothetical protein
MIEVAAQNRQVRVADTDLKDKVNTRGADSDRLL